MAKNVRLKSGAARWSRRCDRGKVCVASRGRLGKYGNSRRLGGACVWPTHRPGGVYDRKPGRAWNRTPPEVEQFILIARSRLRESSVLGEYGPTQSAWP